MDFYALEEMSTTEKKKNRLVFREKYSSLLLIFTCFSVHREDWSEMHLNYFRM